MLKTGVVIGNKQLAYYASHLYTHGVEVAKL